MQLDEQTKARIRAEEEYRAQVQTQLGSSLLTQLGRAAVVGVVAILLLLGFLWVFSQPVDTVESTSQTVPIQTQSAPAIP